MAFVMFQYDRPTEPHRWNDYNQQVREWIAQLLQIPGAVSFMAYRTADGASPDTITLLEFHTVEDARKAQASEQMQRVLEGLRSVGVTAQILLVERSPFTPEPFQA
jgi:quinol monooxygenase YgiN